MVKCGKIAGNELMPDPGRGECCEDLTADGNFVFRLPAKLPSINVSAAFCGYRLKIRGREYYQFVNAHWWPYFGTIGASYGLGFNVDDGGLAGGPPVVGNDYGCYNC
eukprot:COSAG02_NODE_25052_length_670_cov_0.802102_1_plen_106_part_01